MSFRALFFGKFWCLCNLHLHWQGRWNSISSLKTLYCEKWLWVKHLCCDTLPEKTDQLFCGLSRIFREFWIIFPHHGYIFVTFFVLFFARKKLCLSFSKNGHLLRCLGQQKHQINFRLLSRIFWIVLAQWWISLAVPSFWPRKCSGWQIFPQALIGLSWSACGGCRYCLRGRETSHFYPTGSYRWSVWWMPPFPTSRFFIYSKAYVMRNF